jgi:hypothetical protein
MAEKTEVQPTITPQQVQDVEGLLQTLKGKAEQAQQSGDVYMSGIYAVVTPITDRATARLHREDKARLNKGHKALRRSKTKSGSRTSSARETRTNEKASNPTV